VCVCVCVCGGWEGKYVNASYYEPEVLGLVKY
jgi:hypothetical protein